MGRMGRRPVNQTGFTYSAVLAAIAIIGLWLASTGTLWSEVTRREREQQLLWVGEQYRRAIESYLRSSPGAARRYPQSLEDLLKDPRQLATKRHLRRLYRDPITGSPDWGLVRDRDGGIMGVYSKSQAEPLKSGNFSVADAGFAGARRHSEWRFVAAPQGPTAATTGTSPDLTGGTHAASLTVNGIPLAEK